GEREEPDGAVRAEGDRGEGEGGRGRRGAGLGCALPAHADGAAPPVTSPSSRGFTLLELLISLTIFTMVAVIVYATLSFCSRAVDSGEARSTENQRARAALALISGQLKSAYPLSAPAEGDALLH